MEITPTPLTRLDSPYLGIDIPLLPGTEPFILHAGKFGGVPQVWSLDYAAVQLQCDATVANRFIYARLYPDVGASMLMGVQSPAILASTTKSLALVGYTYLSGAVSPHDYLVGISNGMVISGDNYLKIYIGAGQLGDIMSGVLRLKYLNYELGIQTPYDARRKGG